jgi:HEAT repeat protein
LEHVAEHHRNELRELLTCDNPNVQAMAVFALGFGPAENLAMVAPMARYKHPRVRAWAYCALAHLANDETEPTLLRQGLDDPDASVRARAAQAIAACWDTQNPQTAAVATRLEELLDDDSSPVRAWAGRALLHVQGPQALERLQWALDRETDTTVRQQLQDCLSTIRDTVEIPRDD